MSKAGSPMQYKTIHSIILGAAIAAGFSVAVSAAPLPVFPNAVDLTSQACAARGDFITCSAPYLNVLDGLGATQTTNQNPAGYVINSNQGFLQAPIVLGTFNGGQTPVNTDIGPGIDNAYETPNVAPTFTTVGPTDPTSGPTNGGDHVNSWDIELASLIAALTINGDRKDLFIMFDHNQQGGSAADQSIDVWAVIAVRDVLNPLPNNSPLIFELNPSTVGPTNFTSVRTFDDSIGLATFNPGPGTFVTSVGTICLDASNNVIGLVPPLPACPPGTAQEISNNLGTSKTEFINAIPELNAQLESLLAAGYDTISVRFDFARNNGGGDDVYLLAGDFATTLVPEPSSLASLGFGILAAGGFAFWTNRRRRRS